MVLMSAENFAIEPTTENDGICYRWNKKIGCPIDNSWTKNGTVENASRVRKNGSRRSNAENKVPLWGVLSKSEALEYLRNSYELAEKTGVEIDPFIIG